MLILRRLWKLSMGSFPFSSQFRVGGTLSPSRLRLPCRGTVPFDVYATIPIYSWNHAVGSLTTWTLMFESSHYAPGRLHRDKEMFPTFLPPVELFSPSISLSSPQLAKDNGKTVNRAFRVVSPLLQMTHIYPCHKSKPIVMAWTRNSFRHILGH